MRKIKRFLNRLECRKLEKQLNRKAGHQVVPVTPLFNIDRRYLISIKNQAIRHHFFNLYLWVIGRDKQKHFSHRVYDARFDDYIDTLGWDKQVGKYSGSFSDELTDIYWLRFGKVLFTLINQPDRSLYIGIQ